MGILMDEGMMVRNSRCFLAEFYLNARNFARNSGIENSLIK